MREQLLAVEKVQAIEWRDGALYLLDQRLLPHQQTWLRFDSAAEVADAIRDQLAAAGIVVEDTADGYRYHVRD